MMLAIPNFKKLDWLFDFVFHAGLLGINALIAEEKNLIRNYLISLLILSFLLSYYLKKESQNV